MQSEKKIELDQYWEEALHLLIKTNTSFFLTWNWWTWKTFLINHFIKENKKKPEKEQKKIQMLATTWAAATLYDHGETYHSFFRVFWEQLWSTNKVQLKLMAFFDTYIIDEASMISASQMDLLDKRLKQATKNYDELFWWKQVIFVWHLFQASPVVTQWTKDKYEEVYHQKYDDIFETIFFFSAKCFNPDKFKIIELKKTHRTTDLRLQAYLKNLMLWENLVAVCNYFNKNYIDKDKANYDKAIYITNTNSKVNKYNALKLKELQNNWAIIYQNNAKHWNWDVDFYWRITNEPSPQELKYCIWARIMFNKNEDYYKNWTMWTIINICTEFDDVNQVDREAVKILIDWETIPINVFSITWNKYEAQLIKNTSEWQTKEEIDNDDNTDNEHVSYEIVWSYTQYPFTLGWWITAHKSQWKTFDNIIIDIWQICYKQDWEWVRKAVEHIVYVALSRATNYEWIQIVQWLKPNAIAVNQDVKNVTEKLIK